MLHELFLLLSGNPSPLLTRNGLLKSFPLVSPSERALLNNFATLGHLHISLRHACSSITTAHPSMIARAVASGIETHHLQRFRSRILAVEGSILKRESGMVTGYDIVSLAKVMNGFNGWERILRYLHDLVESISPSSGNVEKLWKQGAQMSGAEIINRLRNDIYTGYPTLEEVSVHLLEIAETAWLREISTWVLYGRLPSFSTHGSNSGSTDFFITEVEGDLVQNPGGEEEMGVLKEYTISKQLLPGFVTPQTASSIVFIGRALSMIRLRGGSAVANESTSAAAVAAPEMTLLPVHLSFLQSLKSPLSPQKLTNAIAAIRLSLSRHTLQTLLPAEKVMEAIHVLREFFLVGRGEFALNLIEQASERVRNRWRRSSAMKTSSAGVLIKEGEVSAILTRTWGVLSALQGEEVIDERLDTARDLLYLSLYKPPTSIPAKGNEESFRDTLVGVPVSFNFHLSWPLELFLQPADLEEYDSIFAYLISVRKTQMRLQSLWQGRRNPPTDHISKEERVERKALLRTRESKERKIWATASVAIFFLETLVSYWQGEVIESAFKTLVEVVAPEQGQDSDDDSDDKDGNRDIWRRPSTYTDTGNKLQGSRDEKHRDPESLMRAHHSYLATIKRNLFMSDIVFAPLIKKLLQGCDVMAGGIERLRHRYYIVDLDVEGVDMMGDEETARQNVLDRCRDVTALLKQLMGRLHRIDEEREAWGEDTGGGRSEGAKVDRLLMRMDLGSLEFD